MASNASNRREQLRRQQEAAARQQRTRRVIGIAAGLVALVLVSVLVFVLVNRAATPSATAAQVVPPNASAEKDSLVVAEGRPGTPTVTIYLDYQCPNCRIFEDNYGAMLEQTAMAGDWTLEYKTMVFMDRNLNNTGSTRAALAASCSAVADAAVFPAFSRAIYANQEAQEVRGSVGFSDTLLRETIPATVGLTGETLTQHQTCYDGRATADFVAAVDKAAYADGVSGTPSLAVNGTVLDLRRAPDTTPAGMKEFILSNA